MTTGHKYDHLFISGVSPEIQKNRRYATIGFLDSTVFEGCNEVQVFWVGDKPYGGYGTRAWGEFYHGPHVHKYPELMIHLGTDPDNPWDLGAEIEMHAGPEMEKHIITRSTIFYFPANFVHGPFRIMKVTRPILKITINQSPKHTEKALRNLISKEDQKRMIFIDAGYEDEGIEPRIQLPEEAGPNAKY
jgi:hypothetical protein